MAHALILHHYDASPFSEKVRKLLAHKRLAWRAVTQPAIMPKPDLVALTGGYRRIPVLQVGADVYCDSQLIARTLERLHPSPTFYPGASAGTCHAWSLWADRLLFWPVVAVVFAEIGHLVPKEFMEDRARMVPGRDFTDLSRQAPHAREQLRGLLAMLAAQLADGRPFVLGAEFALADAACFHPLWFLRVAPGGGALVGEFPAVQAWFERVDAMGHGEPSPMEPAEALAIARASAPPEVPPAGERVAVVADDYAFDPVTGTLVHATADEVAVRRRDPIAGEVVVHFPRYGFKIAPAS